MVVSGVAYEVICSGQSFREFSRQISMLDVNGVDVGNINHSINFLSQFLENIYAELLESFAKFLHTSLPCTGQLPPLCLKPDKFTHKHQGAQGLIVRHPCLKNGRLFKETYVSHAKVEDSGCQYWITLMIDAIKTQFNYTDAELRQVFAGFAADGQYIQLHAEHHLAKTLFLPEKFTHDASVWDYCHKLERADFHARKTNNWINKADDVRRMIVNEVKFGNARTQLQRICKEIEVPHREFVSFSDTRFAEYRLCTYKVFLDMHHPLYRLYQELASSDSPEAPDYQERVLNLQDPEKCLKFAFLYDISNILTRTQKHCQDQNSLPPERKQKIELLISCLRAAHSSFSASQIPETISISVPVKSDIGTWPAWKFFKEKYEEIQERHTFQGVPILQVGQQGRRTRNISAEAEEFDSSGLLRKLCPVFSKFLADYLKELDRYFIPWPEWLRLLEIVFFFDNDLEDSFEDRLPFRLSSLEKLMDNPMRPEPLTMGKYT